MNKKEKESIIYRLKDGDVIGYYSSGLFGKLVKYFSKGRLTHVGIVYDVSRTSNLVTFKLSESRITGGKFAKHQIQYVTATDKLILNIKGFHRPTILSIGSLKKNLTKTQIALGTADAESQVGKRYGYTNLFMGIEWLEKILPHFIIKVLKKQRGKKHYQRVCSSHVAINMVKNGSLSMLHYNEDFFYTPSEILALDCFNSYHIKI